MPVPMRVSVPAAQGRDIDGWTRSPVTGILSRSLGDWGERQTHRSDTATRAAILIAYFGADYDVERLNGMRSAGTSAPVQRVVCAIDTNGA